MHVHEHEHSREELSADRPAHSPATKATLWVVLLACVGVIGFVGLRLADIQRDPELEFNIARLQGADHGERIEGLKVLDLIAAERASGAAPRKIDRALPALIEALGDPHNEIRIGAAMTLRTMGLEAADATEALVANLKHEHKGVRLFTVMALTRVAPDDERTVTGAVELARDEDAKAAMAGIASLAVLGERARPAIGALVELAKREGLRDVIADALEAIDPEAASRLR